MIEETENLCLDRLLIFALVKSRRSLDIVEGAQYEWITDWLRANTDGSRIPGRDDLVIPT